MQGAKLVRNADDIIEELQIDNSSKSQISEFVAIENLSLKPSKYLFMRASQTT